MNTLLQTYPFILYFLAFILVISFIISGYKKLKTVDQKIAEFKNKSFSSPEEKDKAKEQLKSELLAIRNKIFWFHGGSRYFIFKIDGKIMNL